MVKPHSSDLLEPAQRRLPPQSEVLGDLIEALPAACLAIDHRQRIFLSNSAATELFGYSIDELTGQPLDRLLCPRLRSAHRVWFDHLFDQLIQKRHIPSLPFTGYYRDGREFTAEVSLGHWPTYGSPLIVALIQPRPQNTSRLQWLAYHDPLTGLPNRTRLQDRLQQALTRFTGTWGAVALLDLNRFKAINDRFGHSTGDALLGAVAQRLRHALRSGDTAARWGGDEFAVVLPALGTEPGAAEARTRGLVTRIQQVLATPYRLRGQELHITARAGFTLFTSADAPNHLLHQADLALTQAKRIGGESLEGFTSILAAEDTERQNLSSALIRAWQRREFVLVYQPQVTAEGTLIGAEALLRWAHPEHGLLSPPSFLATLEASNLTETLGDWILQQVAVHQQRWNTPSLRVAVNLSPSECSQPEWGRRVLEALERVRLVPTALTLELPEAVLAEPEVARAQLAALREHGVRLVLDDFGTGDTGLTSLQGMALDGLKIDRGFIRGLPTTPEAVGITSALLELARHFELGVVAEGVETFLQWEWLRERGCAGYQGFYHSPPLLPAEFERYLQRMPLSTSPDLGR